MINKLKQVITICLILHNIGECSAKSLEEDVKDASELFGQNFELVGINHEIDRGNGRFTFRGFSYYMDCFPIFSKFGERSPDVRNCRAYYEFTALVKSNQYVKRVKCRGKRYYDSEMKKCVSADQLPNDCFRDAKVCENELPNRNLLRRSQYRWLIPIDVNADVRRRNDKTFYYNGYHYNNDCFPIFFEKEKGFRIPDAEACNRFYKYERMTRNNNSIISLKTCGFNKKYDDYAKSCVRVDKLPDGCLKTISGCEGPIDNDRIYVGKRSGQRKSLKYKVANSAITYPDGTFKYYGFLYDTRTCAPLKVRSNELAPDPMDCHTYFKGGANGQIDLYQCHKRRNYFSPDEGECVIGPDPEDCHPDGGCELF